MLKKLLLFSFCISATMAVAQDTFSIVAVDSVTGEVGGAGASCVDMFTTGLANDFLSELFPGVGAINTQAAYDATNQANARKRMNAGDTPAQIISYITTNDVNGNPSQRQYGVIRLINGSPKSAGYTGASCPAAKKHIAGITYCIQGNTLLGTKVIDSMEARFKREQGDLACKLMAALQGANMVGADNRCSSNGTSSLFAFLKVMKKTDTFGNPSFLISVRTHDNAGIEPIDSLQKVFDKKHGFCKIITSIEDLENTAIVQAYPNPVDRLLTIRANQSNELETTFLITDALGRKMAEGKVRTQVVINMEAWGAGIYFLETCNGSYRSKQKIIRQ
ncbi:MAG TPA: DUF1028 domain-containing protein [Bacteroidia bacterium]|jgi:uncharacterized Ntn-hydrolase superfamily protein|nr:DUF1028 domain-containing protein [Bacteroidia bacterium]